MAIESRQVIVRWLNDVTNGGLTTRGGLPFGYSGNPVRVAADGRLLLHRRARPDRGGEEWGPVDLAVWSPASRTIVLNGDGFTDNAATRWQTELRNRVFEGLEVLEEDTEANRNAARRRQRQFGLRIRGRAKYIIIPFVAMQAAGIDPLTVRPIEVTSDRWETVFHQVPPPPRASRFEQAREPRANEHEIPVFAEKDGFRYQIMRRRQTMHVHRTTGERLAWLSFSHDQAEWEQESTWVDIDNSHAVVMAGQRAPTSAQPIRRWPSGGADGREGWGWEERIHHLGASVFSAVDETGTRHRFVSAFDQNEPTPMYYLAQLPTKGRIRTYQDALDALAPPLVHAAIQRGTPVYRQGDVFAIETDRDDEWIYANARTRVRREIVLFNPSNPTRVRGNIVWPTLDEHDFRETGACPCCGEGGKIGWGERCRRALMIYGTSHTATEVAVVSGGAVYIRGTMYHDPHLEEPGRRPEHVTVNLGEENRWHLAVRNTVPRRRGTPGDSNQPEEDS